LRGREGKAPEKVPHVSSGDAVEVFELVHRDQLAVEFPFRKRHTFQTSCDKAQAFGQGAPRAYGEMVNVLWKNGQEAAAIRLEEYWNDLARLYPFSLFCSYMVDCHDEKSYSIPLHEIGRTHSHVLSTDDDDAFRKALEFASRDIFGVPLSQLVNFASLEEEPGENRLPIGQRTMLWIVKNKPESSAAVLERARRYYRKNFEGLTA
jgi:hypothetical protein